MEPCPYCNQLFKRVKTHLRFCKRKPEYEDLNGRSRTENSSGKQRCPYCNELFTRLKTHLHYCNQKPDNEEHSGISRTETSSGKQRCPHCGELFTRLKTHLHYCKQKPDNEEHSGISRTEDSSGKQRCLHCNELFTRLKTHLHYCKQKPDNVERSGISGTETSSGKQRCPHCNELFTHLKTHLYYCKYKPDNVERSGISRPEDSSGKQRCPHCNGFFIRLKTHLHYCKQKPDSKELSVCYRKRDSFYTEIPDGDQLDAVYREKASSYTHNPDDYAHEVNCRESDTSDTDVSEGDEHEIYDRETDSFDTDIPDGDELETHCPHCKGIFKCLKKHLPYCKQEADRGEFDTCYRETDCSYTDDEIGEDLETYDRETGSSCKQQCPHCFESFKSWKKHLPYCQQKPVGEDIDTFCRETDSSDKQRYHHCSRLCKCSEQHLPYCSPPEQVGEEGSVDHREVLRRKLSERLRDAKIDQRQSDSVIEVIDIVKQVMLNILKVDCRKISSMRWQAIHSNSYELVKIDEADAFDLMFTCTVNCDIDFKPLSENGRRISGNYLALKADEDYPLRGLLTQHSRICPKAFCRYFRDMVDKAMEQPGLSVISRRLKVSYNTRSPAVTLRYTTLDNQHYSIDMVPAIELEGFPPESECILRNSWVPEEKIDDLCKKFHVVAKIHPSEYDKEPNRCRLWRLSFSAAEKTMIYRSDGHKTCRKAVLRLLKTDLLDFYSDPTRRDSPQTFSSYYVKMIMLYLYDQIPRNADWEKDAMLLPRYLDALRYWQRILVERNLPYYFKKEVNLMEEIRFVPEADTQLCTLRDHVSVLLATYGNGYEE